MFFYGACVDSDNEKNEACEEHNFRYQELLHGVWLDDFTEQTILKVCGNSIYTAGRFDFSSFFISEDTLVVNGLVRYYIKQFGEYSLRFYTSIGDLILLHKAGSDSIFTEDHMGIL